MLHRRMKQTEKLIECDYNFKYENFHNIVWIKNSSVNQIEI